MGTRTTCTVEGCNTVAVTLEADSYGALCAKHYQRWRNHGDPLYVAIADRGTGHVTPEGYRRISVNGSTILEHRHVMAEHIDRDLLPDETVHHGPGGKLDNRIENLELWSGRHPRGQRVEDLVDFAVEILALYAPERLAPDG